jgi:hypothetical protein
MFKTLRRDIFYLKFPRFPIKKVIPPYPNPLEAAKYACVYCIEHLYHSKCYKKNGRSERETVWGRFSIKEIPLMV